MNSDLLLFVLRSQAEFNIAKNCLKLHQRGPETKVTTFAYNDSFHHETKCIFICVDDVTCVEAQFNYSKLHSFIISSKMVKTTIQLFRRFCLCQFCVKLVDEEKFRLWKQAYFFYLKKKKKTIIVIDILLKKVWSSLLYYLL